MPHQLSIWFMLESISSGSLLWLQIIPQVPRVLCPQGFPFIVLTKQVQMSLLTSLLSLDCPFISELRDPAETGESSKTSSGRPKAQDSCVSLSRYEKIKVPSGSQPDLLFPLNPFPREGSAAPPSKVPVRVQSPGGRPSSKTGSHLVVECQRLCCWRCEVGPAPS